MNKFQFYANTRITFGSGSRNDLPSLLEDNQWTRVAALVDPNIQHLDNVRGCLDALKDRCELFSIVPGPSAEPTYDMLEEIRAGFEDESLQAVIGIGGGSALDTAKAMAVLVRNKKPALDYRGFDRMTEPVLPVIAIPTTAGTGSEITPNASFVDRSKMRKMGINGEAIRPRYAILDPDLILTCPPKATVAAGIDTLVHAMEAFIAKKSNPIARTFARDAIQRVFKHLPATLQNPDDGNARGEVLLAATMAGMAMMNSGTGPAAALSYPLGVRFGVPHGFAGGAFLPTLVENNIKNGCDLYADLTTDVMPSRSPNERSLQFLQEMKALWKTLGVPSDLNDYQVGRSDVDIIVSDCMDLKPALDQNPVPFGETELRAVLAELIPA